MGIFANIGKLNKSLSRKTAINRIGMEAVKQGAVESKFTSEYSAFSVRLREILENALIINDDKSITITPASIEMAKYVNYVLEDTYFISYYDMHKDKAGNLTFKVLSNVLADLEGIEPDVDDNKQTKYEKQLETFLTK